jgi:hypothetical protein
MARDHAESVGPVESVKTLPHHLRPEQVRNARNLRRAGLVLLVLVIVLALLSVLGARTATTAASGSGYTLSVTHAVVTRPAIPTAFRMDVFHPGGFDGPVTLAVSRLMFERFDFQNWYPNPSTETGSDEFVYYEFDPPPGDRLRISLDARTAPDQNGSLDRFGVALVVDGQPITEVGFRMTVLP